MKLSTPILLLALSTLSLSAPAPNHGPEPAPAPAPEALRKERPWPYRYYWGYYPGKRSLPDSEVAKRVLPTIVPGWKPDHITKVDFAVPTATSTAAPIATVPSVITFNPDLFKKPIVVPNPALTWGLNRVPDGEDVENSFLAESEISVQK